MCGYKVTEETNPSFVLYNLVFATPKMKVINSESLLNELKRYDKSIDERLINDSLRQWYKEGRLNVRQGGYILA